MDVDLNESKNNVRNYNIFEINNNNFLCNYGNYAFEKNKIVKSISEKIIICYLTVVFYVINFSDLRKHKHYAIKKCVFIAN